MSVSYTKTRELTIGPAGTALSVYHLTAHQNIDSEIQDISTLLTALGAFTDWASFTPTWAASGGGQSLGNGTLSGRYWQLGKLVIAQWNLTFGSTSSAGSSGYWTFTFPVPQDTAQQIWSGSARTYNSGVGGPYIAFPFPDTNTTLRVNTYDGNVVGVGSPFAWATSDSLMIQLMYAAA